MNVGDGYGHHDHAAREPVEAPHGSGRVRGAGPSELAVHGDPSVRAGASAPRVASMAGGRSAVAWVQPSDLPRLVGMRAMGWGIGRGVDLQVALTRGALRAPGRAAAALGRRAHQPHRLTPEESGGPRPRSAARNEGVGLS